MKTIPFDPSMLYKPIDEEKPQPQTSNSKLAELQMHIQIAKSRLDEVERNTHMVREDYISKEELEPIRKLLFGMVSMVLIAVVGALISLTIAG